jgi:hypothetical protein
MFSKESTYAQLPIKNELVKDIEDLFVLSLRYSEIFYFFYFNYTYFRSKFLYIVKLNLKSKLLYC